MNLLMKIYFKKGCSSNDLKEKGPEGLQLSLQVLLANNVFYFKLMVAYSSLVLENSLFSAFLICFAKYREIS